MERNSPKISVIVPVYNVEPYLERCFGSIAAQTYPNMEVILVDDASTDGSGKICDGWVARDKRFLQPRGIRRPKPGCKQGGGGIRCFYRRG